MADPLITLPGGGPLHRQLYDSVRQSILSGRLPAGARLPASRLLADRLRISRTPVLDAYAQLRAEGYVRGVVGSGTHVADVPPDRLIEAGRGRTRGPPSLPTSAPHLSRAAGVLLGEAGPSETEDGRGVISFRVGQVAQEDFPRRLWRRLLGGAAERVSHGYGPVEGHPPLRVAIARHLAETRAVVCDPEDVFVVAGTRRGLDLVTRLLVDEGDRVALEEPHYPGARGTFLAAGARLAPVPVDDEGVDVARLSDLPADVRLLYLTPSHQFPTGGVLPLSRRLELLAWAEARGAMVVEDDYDAEFQFDVRPVEALKGLDRGGRVVYLGTFAKVLSPDLRLGYVVVPSALREPLRRLVWILDRQCPVVLQAALAALFQEGHYGRHVRRMRRRHAVRRQVLLDTLAGELGERARVQGSSAGVHVLVWFDGLEAADTATLVAEARRRGVELDAVDRTYLGSPPGAGVVLGYGGLREARIREGVGRMAEAVRVVSPRR